MPKKTAFRITQATADISAILQDTREFQALPEALEEAVNQHCPIDWIAIFDLSRRNQSMTITTNPHLPFNWDELYSEIEPYDSFKKHFVELSEGRVLLYDEVANLSCEEEMFGLQLTKKYTNTSQFLDIMGLKTPDSMMGYGFYRSDENHPFSREEKRFFEALSPAIVSFTKTMALYRDFGYKITALEQLIAHEPIRPVIFSESLRPIEIAPQTLTALAKIYGRQTMTALPREIMDWITAVAADRPLKPNTSPRILTLQLPLGTLCCRAFIIKSARSQTVLLIKFKFQEATVSFAVLRNIGLTPKEISVLEYLPLGYTNQQIALAMGVKEVSVKKHIRNAAQKLGAANKTETLFRAMQEKSMLEFTGVE